MSRRDLLRARAAVGAAGTAGRARWDAEPVFREGIEDGIGDRSVRVQSR